jgi:hypothetical protein
VLQQPTARALVLQAQADTRQVHYITSHAPLKKAQGRHKAGARSRLVECSSNKSIMGRCFSSRRHARLCCRRKTDTGSSGG